MKKVLGLTVFLILCLGAPGGVERAWGQSGPIKIGFVGNLSTPWGISSKAAALMAMEEMNNAGGILGRKLQLIVEDTKGEIPKCVEIYKKLVMVDRVLAVVIAEKVEMGVAGLQIGSELFPEYPHIFFNTIGSGDVIWHHMRDNYKKYRFAFQTYCNISTNYLKIWGELNSILFKKVIGAKKMAIFHCRLNAASSKEDNILEWT